MPSNEVRDRQPTHRTEPNDFAATGRNGQREARGDEDERLEELHRRFAQTRDPALREELVGHYDRLALGLVRRLHTRREGFEDLAQVARLALLNAIDRFDPERARPFAAFAQVTITGELKRHLRDRTWAMRVPRSLQEHFLVVIRTADDLTGALGRSPRIDEVAAACGLSQEQVLEAMDLARRQHPRRFESPTADHPHPFEPVVVETGFQRVERHELAAHLLSRLSEGERNILQSYFFEGRSQQEIADAIGMSQMYVSRLIGRLLVRLRTLAGGAHPEPALDR